MLGRVEKINKKSIKVKEAGGKSFTINNVKFLKNAPTPQFEISMVTRKKSEADRLR